jgi:hypothetical protein
LTLPGNFGKFQAPPKVANSFPGKENVGKENTEQTKHIFLSCIFFSRKTVSWRMKLAKGVQEFVKGGCYEADLACRSVCFDRDSGHLCLCG